ncbi:hypothetical protein SCH01S_33_00100 [Sphingomonas changbaiensis NBRC 104936]|uniref:Bacteriophage-related protein n=1 Tax=Sphingomonas changbaiensis NBRC 104936 TaxID=1219043 RepID=A0A0E9MPV5_9SPHN|nr:DUF2924 domain-containing protein [Sphingomonas changbaiensis]GAO39523.1 hypothetical protein SCH01S_33_00100 [Sphingomonas changbaiensis NBRC 104936]
MNVDEHIEQLRMMTFAQLKSEWRRVWRRAPPVSFTSDLLMRGIAYRLQEKAFGGLAAEIGRELDGIETLGKSARLGTAQTVQLRPGNRLVRRWRGTTYTVDVTRDGFLFQDRRYASLSTIATEITGTRWSGPRFFGLKEQAR